MRLHFNGTNGHVPESSREYVGHSAFVLEAEGSASCATSVKTARACSRRSARTRSSSRMRTPTMAGACGGTSLPVHASAATHGLLAELPLLNRVTLAPEKSVGSAPSA